MYQPPLNIFPSSVSRQYTNFPFFFVSNNSLIWFVLGMSSHSQSLNKTPPALLSKIVKQSPCILNIFFHGFIDSKSRQIFITTYLSFNFRQLFNIKRPVKLVQGYFWNIISVQLFTPPHKNILFLFYHTYLYTVKKIK